MNDRQYKDAVFGHWARVGKAVGSPKRLELLEVLAQGPRTVEVLAELTDQTVANASQHLRILRSARLVESDKRGLFVFYRIADREVTAFLRTMRTLAEHRIADIQRISVDFLSGRTGLEKVDRTTLLRRVRNGEVTVLDVRPVEEFQAAHIPGAVSVPLAELRKRIKDLPRNRELVAYCRGPYSVLSVQAVEQLRKAGFKAARLEESIPDWQACGYQVSVG